jgi:TolB protein
MDDVPPPEAFEAAAVELESRRPSRVRRWLRIGLILAVVAALVVLAAVQGQAIVVRGDLPTGPFGNARLVVLGEGGSLDVLRADGTARQALPATGTPYQFPAWSPDGSRIAAIGQRGGSAGVFVMAPGNGLDPPPEPIVIYESAEEPPFYLYWTPDSRQLTFLTTEADSLALRMAPADGSAPATSLREGAPMYWDFVDESRLFVHTGNVGPDEFLGEVTLDGTAQAGTESDGGFFRAPTISADGRLRAYLTTAADGIGSVRTEARDGSGTTEVSAVGPAALAFAPNGDTLAFIGPEPEEAGRTPLPIGSLRVIRPGATEAQVIGNGRYVAYFWAPSGTLIGALRIRDAEDPVTQANRAVTRLASTGITPVQAGVGLQLDLVDVEAESVRTTHEVTVSDLFVNQVLPFFDQYALSHRFWSPDSSAMVLPLVDENEATQIVAIPADGSEFRVVSSGALGFWRP